MEYCSCFIWAFNQFVLKEYIRGCSVIDITPKQTVGQM